MSGAQFATEGPDGRTRIGTWRVGRSVRTRLLASLLGLTIASALTIAYLSVSSILGVGQSAQQASSAALRDQAKENLVRLTVVTAEKNNLLLENVRQDAKNVAQYAAAIFEHPVLLPVKSTGALKTTCSRDHRASTLTVNKIRAQSLCQTASRLTTN